VKNKLNEAVVGNKTVLENKVVDSREEKKVLLWMKELIRSAIVN